MSLGADDYLTKPVSLAFLERVEKPVPGRAQIRLRDTAEPVPVSLRLAPALNRKLKAIRAGGNDAAAPGSVLRG